MKQYLKLFEEFSRIYESDTLETAGLAKRIYNDLRKKGMKVELDYQNETMAKKAKMAHLGEERGITVAYAIDGAGRNDFIHVLGFEDKNQAESLVREYESENISARISYSYEKWTVTFTLKQEEQRQKYNVGRGYSNRENKNDRKRKRD